MKTTMKAAILLLSGAIFFSQASLAGKGKPDDKPPSKDDCTFEPAATVCDIKLLGAYTILDSAVFKNSRDLTALQCKVRDADLKVSDGKFDDAVEKLSAAAAKIDTLYMQGKILDDEGKPDYAAAAKMNIVMNDAKLCLCDDFSSSPDCGP